MTRERRGGGAAGIRPAMPAPFRAEAQEIPRDEYLRFVPLQYPRAASQTEANRRFDLFGDRDHPDYVDRDPVDGIDDRRGERLEALALRFAPYMVRNTTSVPREAGSKGMPRRDAS